MTYMKNIFTIHLPTEAVSLCWIIRNKPELIKTVNLIYPISYPIYIYVAELNATLFQLQKKENENDKIQMGIAYTSPRVYRQTMLLLFLLKVIEIENSLYLGYYDLDFN